MAQTQINVNRMEMMGRESLKRVREEHDDDSLVTSSSMQCSNLEDQDELGFNRPKSGK